MDWLRLYAEFGTDPKVQMMSEAMQRRLIMLFCLQCGNGIETFHVTERETSIGFALRISAEETATTKAEFFKRGFINDDWTLRNWSKRQYVSDSSTARVRKHREAKKQEASEAGNKVKRFRNATEQNRTDTEQNRTENETSPDETADLFAGIAPDVVRDFKAVRKSKKAAVTKTAMDGIKREADKAGISLEAALRTCCERGWSGFKAEWYANAGGTPGTTQPPKRRKQLGEGSSTNYGPADPAVLYGNQP
jgi:hypothetical protein